MFPTLASLIEERLLDDPALTQIAIHAFNEWLHDEWGYDYEGRIFATPDRQPVHRSTRASPSSSCCSTGGPRPCCCARRR